MILLDTDHLSVLLDPRHASQRVLLEKLRVATDPVAIPIVAVEEQLRGWLAQIHRSRTAHALIVPYERLAKLVDFLSHWDIAHWNEAAADTLEHLKSRKIRIGTQDLRIAALAIANDAVLLSANLRDFRRVPGLRCEDWLYG